MKKGLVAFALLLALALLPFAASNMVVFATMVMAKGLAVLGILVLLRADQVSFGHAMFFAAGAYTAAFLTAAWRDIDRFIDSGRATSLISTRSMWMPQSAAGLSIISSRPWLSRSRSQSRSSSRLLPMMERSDVWATCPIADS